jgi:hypothetical protein
MNRTVLAIDRGSVDQANAITIYALARGWHVWHWLEGLWLLAGLPDEMTPPALWQEVIRLPGLLSIRGLAFRVGSEPLVWGGNAPESWAWLLQYWGKDVFPPHLDPAETRS